MRTKGTRLLLALLAVCYFTAVAFSFRGQWYLDHKESDRERGLRWNPRNPYLWTAYGKYWLYHPDGFQPERAAQAYLRAASLNPFDPENWEGLAAAYQQMGDTRKAETAFRLGLAAVPRSPESAWRFANFLLLAGRSQEAAPYLRVAAAADIRLRTPVFDLAWKILDRPEAILRDAVPADFSSRRDYFQFLQARGKLAEAHEVWREIRRAGRPEATRLGYAFVEVLASNGFGALAAAVWKDVLEDTGKGRRGGGNGGNERITNGDFEEDPAYAGLDWHVTRGDSYRVALDNFVVQQGSRSMHARFDGTANLDFAGVWQMVPVEPNRRYRFRGYIKTENVSTDSGMRFSLSTVAAPAAESFVRYTPSRIGSDPWTLEELEFKTGPNTRVIHVALRRLPSQRLNNRILGKVWVDNISLQPVD